MNKCPNCKYILPAIADFCTNCGVDIAPSPDGQEESQAAKAICSVCAESHPRDAIHKVNGKPVCLACVARASTTQLERNAGKQKREARFRAMTGAKGDHRRETKRFEVPRTFAQLRKRGLLARVTGQGGQATGPVLDLSLSGMQCISELEFFPEDKIDIRLTVPAYNSPLLAVGIVRWIYAEGRNHRLGVQFESMDEKTCKHLEGLQEYETLREVGKGGL
ncbi:MAG: PilZ domain-containing protein [Planctomycetota bacterium]|jgi:hypothetical protein